MLVYSQKIEVYSYLPSPMRARSRHHFVPRSRCVDVDNIFMSSRNENLKAIHHIPHVAWHRMFGNMTPLEVCVRIARDWGPRYLFDEFTVCTFWEGHYSWVNLENWDSFSFGPVDLRRTRVNPAAWRIVFGTMGWAEAIEHVLTEWVPPMYVVGAHFKTYRGEDFVL